VFRSSKVPCLPQKLGFRGVPICVALIILFRNDLHSNVAMNLINRSMDIAEMTTTDVITYYKI